MELLGTRLFLIRMKTVSNNYCEKVPYWMCVYSSIECTSEDVGMSLRNQYVHHRYSSALKCGYLYFFLHTDATSSLCVWKFQNLYFRTDKIMNYFLHSFKPRAHKKGVFK
jgi:hypothetical protein